MRQLAKFVALLVTIAIAISWEQIVFLSLAWVDWLVWTFRAASLAGCS